MLVRNHIIQDGNELRVPVTPHTPRNGAEAGSHEGQPELGDHQIGLFAPDLPPHLYPVEGVAGVDFPVNAQVFRCRFVTVLGFARKQKSRVLQGEGVDFHLMPLILELIG